ncbi:g2375 [Coccomyxa viridis]|uniref:G2375 protein n=1 Tax=Coccomyxa viridis TaxID=1274662 RepID=A0ABP1FQP4_9CHLO
MAQPNSLLSLLNDDEDEGAGSTDASAYQALFQGSLGNGGGQSAAAAQRQAPQVNGTGAHAASQAVQRQHTPAQQALAQHAHQPAQQQQQQQPLVYRAPAASQPAPQAAQQVSMGGSQYPLNSPAFQQQLQAAQITLKNLPPETQQGVLKEWTAMYQKSGTTYNHYLASLQQRHAAQRQAQSQPQLSQSMQQAQFQHPQRQPSPQPRLQQAPQQQQSSTSLAQQQVPQHAQAQQATHQANGIANGVDSMRQWLGARIAEPARRILNHHMDSYALSQHDAQKQREWTKRLTDIVGLKLVADYQSTLQGGPAQQQGGPARSSTPTPPPRLHSASPQPHSGVPITQNTLHHSQQASAQPQQQQQRLQQQVQYSQAMQQQYRPPGLPTTSAPQQQQQYQRPPQPQVSQHQQNQHQQNQYQMRLQQQHQQQRLQQQHAQQGPIRPPLVQSSLQQAAIAAAQAAQAARQAQTSSSVLGKQPASSGPAAEPAAKRPKKDEEDFNDVLQGTNVNLEAEKEGMLGSTQSATTIAGLPPEKLVLNRRPLEEKAKAIATQHGIPTISPNLHAYMSRALEAHMGDLLRRAYVIARQRSDVGRRMPAMEKAGDSARTEVYAIEEWERVQAEAALAKEQEEAILQAAARENKDNKEVKERAERARAAKAEREGAAATAQAYKSALGLAAKHDWGAAKPKAAPAGAAVKPEKQEPAAASSPEKAPAPGQPNQPELPASAQSAADKAGNTPGVAPARWGMRAPALQKPQQGERRTLALKDLIATLERDPNYCKSTFLYKLYERLD